MNAYLSKDDIKSAYNNKIKPNFILGIIKNSEFHFTNTIQEPEFISSQNLNNSFKKLKKKTLKKKKKKQLSKCSSSFNVENASKDMKVWMIFRNNKNEGPFMISDIFNIIKTSYDPSLILIKNLKLNKLFTTDFFLETYKRERKNSSQGSNIKEPLFSKNTSDKYEENHIVFSLKNEYPINSNNLIGYSNSFGPDQLKCGYFNANNNNYENDNKSTPINRNNSNPHFITHHNQPIINKFRHSFNDYGAPFSKGEVSIESDDSDESNNPFKIIDLIKNEGDEGDEYKYNKSNKSDYLYKNFLDKDEKSDGDDIEFNYINRPYVFPNQPKSLPHLMSNKNQRYTNDREKHYNNQNFFGEDYGNNYNDVYTNKKEKYQKADNRKNGSFFSDNLELQTKNQKFRNKQKSLNVMNKKKEKEFKPNKFNRYQKNNNRQNYQENFSSSYRMKNSFKSEKQIKKKKKNYNGEEEDLDYYYKKEQNYQPNEGYKNKKSSYNQQNKKYYKKKPINSKTNRFYVKKNEN